MEERVKEEEEVVVVEEGSASKDALPSLLPSQGTTWTMERPLLRRRATRRDGGRLGRLFARSKEKTQTWVQSLAYYAASLTTATNMGIILSLMPLMALTAAIKIGRASCRERV